MENSRVSIVIPMYNVEEYIDTCLWSLRKQTYKNIEIIVVDDKSQDKSLHIAQRHGKEDFRIKVYMHEKNKKQGAARNTGIRAAQGKYIMFLDSDDLYPLDAVQNMVEAIERSKADMVIGRMGWLKGNDITPVEYIDYFINEAKLFSSNLRNMSAEKWYLGPVCNRIYQLDWLREQNIFFDEGVFWEDVSFSANVWYHAKFIDYSSHIVYLRTERENEDNLSTTQNYDMKKYLDRDYLDRSILDMFAEECKENPLLKKDVEIIMNRIYCTTKAISLNRNANIANWAEEWFRGYSNRHNEMKRYLLHL